MVGFTLTAVFAVIWAAYNAPAALRWYRGRRQDTLGRPESPALHAAAEEAEQWMFSLGSHGGGMAAAEWFSLNESQLREVLRAERPHEDTVDDLARICAALEVWYVRRHAPGDLLELSEFLTAVADGCGRRDLAELALVRAATAYRLMGDLASASALVDNAAPARRAHSRTSAALETRRQVERALLHLAQAERAPAGNERDDAVLNARDRLDSARLSRPGPDLAAEVAIHINIAIVRLYQQDPEGALDHLRPAAAQAATAGDLSGEAHALELMGMAAWMLSNPKQAREWWKHAEGLYAAIDEREGRARCLQHLGSADVVAGRHARGRRQLEESVLLRGRETELVTRYLEAAAAQVGSPGEPGEPDEGDGVTWHRLSGRWLLRRLRSGRNQLRRLTDRR